MGWSASAALGPRRSGSSQKSSKVIVVPERAGPVMRIGASIDSLAMRGVRVPGARELEARAQAAEELLPGHEPTDDGQRLRIEGLHQGAEAALPVRIAEVAEGSAAEALARLLEEGIGVERDDPARGRPPRPRRSRPSR
jgi:hypothetical protein